jgi:hypothetical protein
MWRWIVFIVVLALTLQQQFFMQRYSTMRGFYHSGVAPQWSQVCLGIHVMDRALLWPEASDATCYGILIPRFWRDRQLDPL